MNRLHRWTVLLAATTMLSPFAGDARAAITLPAGSSCADCCKLPCIEAQLWEARYRRFVYDRMSKIKNLDKASYEKRQGDAEQTSSVMRAIYVGSNMSCNPWTPTDPSQAKELGKEHGIGTEWDGGQVVKVNYTLSVDPMTCELNKPTSPEVMPKISACVGMGEAVIEHEMKHMAECQQRVAAAKKSGKALQPPTPAENAKNEVNGYDAEIKRLEKARNEAAQPCMKESCKDSQRAFDRSARLLGTDLEKLVGKAKKKPVTKSPTRRTRGGK